MNRKIFGKGSGCPILALITIALIAVAMIAGSSFAATYNLAAVGGSIKYTWNNLTPGTYLYLSGSHPAKQVQMGLYGTLKVYAADAGAYPGISPDNEVLLLYSEIDPKLHAPDSPKVANL